MGVADLNKVDPLSTASRIGHATDGAGRLAADVVPSSFLIRQWTLIRSFVNGAAQNLAALIAAIARIDATTITGGGVLGGGGAIGAGNQVITHDTAAVTPGTYGDDTNVPQITVDQYGHVTAVADVPISFPPGTVAPLLAINQVADGTSVSAFCFKGFTFTPSQTIKVYAIWGNINSIATTSTYAALAGLLSGGGTTPTFSGAPTQGPNQTPSQNGSYFIRLPFSSPVTLTAGSPYALCVGITSGVGTTALSLPLGTGAPTQKIALPGIASFAARVSNVAPGNGTSVDTNGGAQPSAGIAIEWSY